MTTQEFSNMFDTLLNSYNTLAMFGELASKADVTLDEYEKSVLLTLAQDIIVKSFFERTGNALGEGFDDSTRRLADFSSLVTVASSNVKGQISYEEDVDTYDDRGKVYKLPKNILLMLNEKVIVKKIDDNGNETGGTKPLIVVPINYKEYDRLMSKAYALPLKKQCWRLFLNKEGFDILSELIPVEGTLISEYRIRYVRRPRPIILVDLSFNDLEDLEIDGVKTISECELNPILHMEILNKALELALTTRGRMLPASSKQREE